MKKEEKPKDDKKKEKKKKIEDEYDERRKWYKDPFIIGFLSLVIIGIFIFAYNVNFKVRDITEFKNDDLGYILKFQEIGEPMLLGKNKIRATFKTTENEIIEESMILVFNKGETINEENITINWLEEYVEISIKGEGIIDTIKNMNYKS